MITSALLAACLLLSQADSKTPAVEKAEVDRLVRQLDHRELARREAAEKAIVAMGPDALDLLPHVAAGMPAETKQRLIRIRSTLEKAAVEAATRATAVTLHGEGLPLSEVLAAIEKQTGNRILPPRGLADDVTVDVDFDDTPYWEALDQVLDQAGLSVYIYEKGVTKLVPRREDMLPRHGRAAYSGPFRFEPTHVRAVRDLRHPSNRGLALTMEISWEPRLSPILLTQSFEDVTATDDAGAPIEIDGSAGRLEAAEAGNNSGVELDIPLVLPERSVTRIASLRGTLVALMPGRIETYEFTDLLKAKNVEQRKAGVTVVLQTVRKNVDVYEVRILVRFDKAANALESHRGWILDNEAYLLAPDGERLEKANMEATLRAANEVGLAYLFAMEKVPAGYKFVYKTPAGIVKMPIPYEVKNIELP